MSVGFIAYGLVNRTKDDMEPILIRNFCSLAGMDQANISCDGFNDIIICFGYGHTITDTDHEDG